MSDEEISFAFDAARGGVIASAASEEIAILEGLVGDDLANITSTFFLLRRSWPYRVLQ
jgi:hypothetical protein